MITLNIWYKDVDEPMELKFKWGYIHFEKSEVEIYDEFDVLKLILPLERISLINMSEDG